MNSEYVIIYDAIEHTYPMYLGITNGRVFRTIENITLRMIQDEKL